MSVTRTKYMLGPRRVGDDRLERVGHDVANPDRSSQVIHEVCSTNLGFDEVGVQDVALNERDCLGDRCEIGEVPRRQVVKNSHSMAGGNERCDKMGTNESCPTGDENVHSTSFMCVFRIVVGLVS